MGLWQDGQSCCARGGPHTTCLLTPHKAPGWTRPAVHEQWTLSMIPVEGEGIFCPDPSLRPLLSPHSPPPPTLGITSHSCPVSMSHSLLFPQPQASRVRPVSQVLAREDSRLGPRSRASAGKGLGHPALLAPPCDAVAGVHEAAQSSNHSVGKTSWGSRPLGSASRAQSSPGRMNPPSRTPQKPSQHHSTELDRRGTTLLARRGHQRDRVTFPGQEVTGPSYAPGEKHSLMPPSPVNPF